MLRSSVWKQHFSNMVEIMPVVTLYVLGEGGGGRLGYVELLRFISFARVPKVFPWKLESFLHCIDMH